MDLAIACIDRIVIKYGRLEDELVVWRNKCFDSKSFYTHPDTNAIDFDTFWNELKYKNTSLSDDNQMLICVDNINKNLNVFNPVTTTRVHWTRNKILSCIILIITCPRQAGFNEFAKYSCCNIYTSLG